MTRIRGAALALTVTAGLLVAAATGASADPPGTTGLGTTHGGFAFVVNIAAMPGGTGEGTFEYHPIVNDVDLDIHCRDFEKYVSTLTNSGAPKSIFNSNNCFGQDPNRGEAHYYVHAEATDRAPGIGLRPAGKPKVDTLCVTVKYFPGKQNPEPVVKDCGPLQSGDIGIVLPV